MSAEQKPFHAVVFRIGDEELALDVDVVREIVHYQTVSRLPQAPETIEGIIELRKHIIAVMDLRKRFGVQSSRDDDKVRIIIVRAKRMIIGLVVDAVQEVIKISRENIHPSPAVVKSQIHHPVISGIARWENRIIMIMNMEKLISIQEAKLLANLKSKKTADKPPEGEGKGSGEGEKISGNASG